MNIHAIPFLVNTLIAIGRIDINPGSSYASCL